MKTDVYCIKNISKNIYYIGQTLNFKPRIAQHFNLLRLGTHTSKKMQIDFNNGDLFVCGIIKSFDGTDIYGIENDFIEEFNKKASVYNKATYPKLLTVEKLIALNKKRLSVSEICLLLNRGSWQVRNSIKKNLKDEDIYYYGKLLISSNDLSKLKFKTKNK